MKTFLFWLSLFGLLFFRFLFLQTKYPDGQNIKIAGQVLSEPVVVENYQKFSLQNFDISLPKFPEIHYGDWIIVSGEVKENKLWGARLVEITSPRGRIYRIREKIISFYRQTLPEPQASLIAGVTLGSKSAMPQDFWQVLKNTGVAHVVVASGMNVSMVISFLLPVLLLVISRKKAIWIVLVGVILYVFLSGFDAPIIRAAIMGGIVLISQEEGKLVTAWKALVFTALIMLIINPNWVADLGFILSFMATTSLMLFEAKIRKLLFFVPEILKEGLSTSFAAQIGVAPILWVTFGNFNLLSPLVNALVLWTIPYLTVLGMLGGVIGWIIFPLGQGILYLSYPLGWYFVKVVEYFGA